MQLSPESLSSVHHVPGRLRTSSSALDWRWPLAQVLEQPAVAEQFETPVNPDLLVVMGLTGSFRIESRAGRGWHCADYRRGTIGLTAPGSSDVLRWRDADTGPRTTLHVHLPADLVEQTHDAVAPGRRRLDLNALDRIDPVSRRILFSLHTSLEVGADRLVAESLAQALVARLLTATDSRAVSPTGSASRLSERTLARVVGYMRAHLHQQVTLDDLARQANLSKYHFLRLFSARTGVTPHRYLTELRMQRAAELLITGRRSITSVAALCGYASASRFSASFRARFGTSPGRFRAG